jgi:phage terminase large subunit-like protein
MFDPNIYPNCASGHQYALDVVAGNIVACKYVIGACKRYLKEVVTRDAGWYFDADAAEKYLRSVQKFNHVIGHWPTKTIIYEPWQKWVWMNIMGFKNATTGFRRFRIAHVEIARGNAKALCLNTDVPTPDKGLVKFGSLEIGSKLYSTDGTICQVIGKNEIHFPSAFRIHFSDGTKVDCSDEHLWVTSSKHDRKRGTSSVRNTRDIFRSVKIGKESNHSVKVCDAVTGSRGDCQLPYVLGYWLGDGHSSHGKFTAHKNQFKEIASRFKSNKLEIRITERRANCLTFLVSGLTNWLKEINVLNNKHIPEKYFTAPEHVRRELLRGLMDSDGSASKEIGNFTFCNVNETLAKGVRRLVASLGYKATIRRTKTKCQNGYVGHAFYVTFSSPTTRPSIFGIRAKEDRRSNRPTRYCDKRYITKVEKIDSKPMFCIEVDSKDKTFLITDQYIPTHNSAMASQAALYFLALDNPNGNQISTVATKKDQARIVLDSARQMARKSSSYLKHTGVKVLAHSLSHPSSGSVVRSLASEHSGLDGLNDILAILDELHAMKQETFEVIYSGMSKRTDSLTLCITTAGKDVHSIGCSQSAYAKKVSMGDVSDDQFFAVVYTLDEGDDWEEPKNWIKSNPNLGVSVDVTTLKAKVDKALVTPADVNNIKIKHMNLWIGEALAFYDQAIWDKCFDPSLKIEDFKKIPCRLGLDLASHIDITSRAMVFRKDGIYYIFDRSYLPEETVRTAKNVIYDESVAKGFLISTPGAAINYDHIQKEAEEFAKDNMVIECIYDAWNATETAQRLSNKIEMVKIAMNTANLSEPMKKLDALMRSGKVRHNGSPLVRWCLGNVVAKEDHNGNVFPRKSHLKLKIDPIIAILMALAGWLQDEDVQSVYEERGIRVL